MKTIALLLQFLSCVAHGCFKCQTINLPSHPVSNRTRLRSRNQASEQVVHWANHACRRRQQPHGSQPRCWLLTDPFKTKAPSWHLVLILQLFHETAQQQQRSSNLLIRFSSSRDCFRWGHRSADSFMEKS